MMVADDAVDFGDSLFDDEVPVDLGDVLIVAAVFLTAKKQK